MMSELFHFGEEFFRSIEDLHRLFPVVDWLIRRLFGQSSEKKRFVSGEDEDGNVDDLFSLKDLKEIESTLSFVLVKSSRNDQRFLGRRTNGSSFSMKIFFAHGECREEFHLSVELRREMFVF